MACFKSQRPLLVFLVFLLGVSVALSSHVATSHSVHHRSAQQLSRGHKAQNTTNLELEQAQKLVDEAVAQQSIYNTHRVAHPLRNTYVSRHSAKARSFMTQENTNAPVAPAVNDTLRKAARLVAEHHASQQKAQGLLHKSYPQPKYLKGFNAGNDLQKRDSTSSFWVGDITHTGHAPMGADDSYLVFRDVTNPIFAGGAKGDGVTDDTDAINAAIAYDDNCGSGCLSSSTKGTLIYFPHGTYLISTPINAYYYSQLVGDAVTPPTIKTSPGFVGLGAIQTDVYIPNASSGEWYIEQSNFYRQVRNFIIDISESTVAKAAGLHWQVAQATSLTNVFIHASTDSGENNTQIGIFTENGSGGFMSDVFITGGEYGIYGGNQQYTVRNFEISGQTNSSICLLWDWGWTWSGLKLSDAPVGISLINPEDPTITPAGSVYIMDSLFDSMQTGILAHDMKQNILDTSIITLDNIHTTNVDAMVAFTDGEDSDIPQGNIEFIVIGDVEMNGASQGLYSIAVGQPGPSLLDTGATAYYRSHYFSKSRPQYEDLDVGSILSVKDHGAKGDGVTDDTAAIKTALALATTSNLIYFPAGSYIVTSTITVPPNTRMTGEVWSQLVASGPYFANVTDPMVMIKVGNPGDIGTVEISDMLFTSVGSLPGLVMVEWNVQADSQGSVGIWDAHFRVGGAYGSELQVAQCPNVPSIPDDCVAAAMILHITPESNGYFENMWAWVADHDLDDALNTMVTVAVGRGILVESADGPTWFYGTASEHSMLYQYNFYNTTNVLAGMIQTESPYFQYATATMSPGPFNSSIGVFNNDPIFPDGTCNGTDLMCDFAWAVMVNQVDNLTIAGAGLYSWFDAYDQSVCVDAQNCQQRLFNDQGGNGGFWMWNLVTIGSVEMISNTENDAVIYAKNNTQADAHPFWSALAGYLDDYNPLDQSCPDNDTSSECMTNPLCDNTKTFATLDDLQAAAGTFPAICTDYYALGILRSTLSESLANYTNVDNGYDAVFGYYVEYVKDIIPDALNEFMDSGDYKNPSGGPGNKYFDCTFQSGTLVETQQCPWTYLQLVPYDDYTITYKLKNSTGFYEELSSAYGINSSWVSFGTVNHGSSSCGNDLKDCLRTKISYDDFPQKSGNVNVPNPKDVITAALPNIDTLQKTILSRYADLATNSWYGPTDDVLQVISMPVFMIWQAVNAMANAKSLGQAQAKADKVKLILEILGIVFIFVPFLDDIAPEVEALDGVLNTVAALGNVALSIQAIVADPISAPMELLGLLTAGGTKDEEDFAKMAETRRGIPDDDLGKIGTFFQDTDHEFQDIIELPCSL